MWDEMTFIRLLLATEEMQSQQRAENGVEEVVIGYFSDSDDAPAYIPEFDVGEFDGMVKETAIDDLPDDVRSVVLAEHHRLTTGEIKKTAEFSRG